MTDQTISRFWDNYTDKLKTYGAKPEALRWYVRHAESYIKSIPDRRLAQHTVQDVEQYLQDKGRKTGQKDWQFQQMVKALQVLFVDIVKASWAPDFPWQYWADGARDLPAAHATVARDYDTSMLEVDTLSGVNH